MKEITGYKRINLRHNHSGRYPEYTWNYRQMNLGFIQLYFELIVTASGINLIWQQCKIEKKIYVELVEKT